MGTTESIFYQDDEPSSSFPGTSGHSSSTASTTRRSRPSSSGQMEARKPRQRPPATLLRLSGIVVGMAQTGKQTLLQRLEGKDPYASRVDDPSVNSETLVPYQAPADKAVWDRIQLHVRISRTLYDDIPIDFCVVLINPLHDANRVKDYLTETIQTLLTILGYNDETEDDRNGRIDARKRPLCLCLLLNFRDLQSSDKEGLQESDVQSLTMEVLQKYPTLDASRLVLQCGRVSLQNCYGLQLLHHFIYQSYLQRKQSELEDFLQSVRQAQVDSRTAPMQTYKDFMAMLQPDAVKKSVKRRDKTAAKRIDEDETSTSNQEDDDERLPVASDEAEKPRERPKGRRKILQDKQKPLTRRKDDEKVPSSVKKSEKPSAVLSSKDALEAFLASEDEDEDDVPLSRLSRKRGNVDESDSDDDEFFYDEAGKRHMHLSDKGLEDEKPAKEDADMAEKSKIANAQSKRPKSKLDEKGPRKDNRRRSEAKDGSAERSKKPGNLEIDRQALAGTSSDTVSKIKEVSSKNEEGGQESAKVAIVAQEENIDGSQATKTTEEAVGNTNGDQHGDTKIDSTERKSDSSGEGKSRDGSVSEYAVKPKSHESDIESHCDEKAHVAQSNASTSQQEGVAPDKNRSGTTFEGGKECSRSNTEREKPQEKKSTDDAEGTTSAKEKESRPRKGSHIPDDDKQLESTGVTKHPPSTEDNDSSNEKPTGQTNENGTSARTDTVQDEVSSRFDKDTHEGKVQSSTERKSVDVDAATMAKSRKLSSQDDASSQEEAGPTTATSVDAHAKTVLSDDEKKESHAVAATSNTNSGSDTKTEVVVEEASSGLSKAALAAIQAAQEQAEKMLEQELEEPKQLKKKKDGEKKKKKRKEKKAKRSKSESTS